MRSLLLLLAASLAVAGPVQKRAGTFQFFGINESGPEFGHQNLPGLLNKDYVWPDLNTIDQFIAKGMNTFRINFQQERLVPNSMTGPMDQAYLADLVKTVNYITNKGAWAMIVPHNYGRYYGNPMTDPNAFKTYWRTTAAPFKNNPKVIFDINNEFWGMDQNLVVKLNQAGIDGIRAAGATSQPITAEGNLWTGAWTWTSVENGASNAGTMGNLTDPSNKLYYQMHQYLDSDSSGTSENCVSSTIGKERLVEATKWLRDNKKLGILGEYAGGNNEQCKTAVRGMLQYMKDNSDVWKGAVWWAAGPWWANYMYSMEPTTGPAWSAYADLITQYA